MYYVTRKQKMCYARYEKPLKTTLSKWPINLWKRIPHLMQQHMTPRKGYNFISLDITQYTNAKKKRKKRAKRTTDWRRMIQIFRQSPKYPLNNPHNHPRTSKSCRQNINFWLIHSRHSNVRNYIFCELIFDVNTEKITDFDLNNQIQWFAVSFLAVPRA